MKLRVQDNSIRFRLTRGEVEKLATLGRVEGSVLFAPGADTALKYALETSLSEEIRAQHTSNEISVTLPKTIAQTWACTNQVSIEHLQVVGPDLALQIVVEKDFRCAHGGAPADESASDLYPNPNLAARSPG